MLDSGRKEPCPIEKDRPVIQNTGDFYILRRAGKKKIPSNRGGHRKSDSVWKRKELTQGERRSGGPALTKRARTVGGMRRNFVFKSIPGGNTTKVPKGSGGRGAKKVLLANGMMISILKQRRSPVTRVIGGKGAWGAGFLANGFRSNHQK